MPIRMAWSMYARNMPVPWPDANLPERWLLDSRHVPVPPIPRKVPERVPEIMRWRALLPPHLRRDPVFAITSSAWDMFGSWECQEDRRAGYLGDNDWDQRWAPEAPNNDGGGDDGGGGDGDAGGGHNGDVDDGDFHDGNDDNGRQPPPPPPSCDDGTVKAVRDDTDDFIGNVVYNVVLANKRGEHDKLLPKLKKDENLQVAILMSAEEEKRAFLGLEDALTLSVALPPSPGPPPRRPAESSVLPAPAPGPPSPPMASWPWPQGPFINLSGKDEDEDSQA
jgi:hypothetical protein